jgi:phage baseplate assembly protein gpV
MADLYLSEQSAPSTPASGNLILYPDSTASRYFAKDDAGRVSGSSHNASITTQGAGFATDTYVADSDILIPSFGVQVRTAFRWTMVASKTAAGVATPVYSFRIGSARTTADTARLQITGPAQTAAIDFGTFHVMLIVQSVGAAGVIRGVTQWKHDGAAVGFANNDSGFQDGTSAGFDNSALGGQYIGLSIDGGASAAWTLRQVIAEALW